MTAPDRFPGLAELAATHSIRALTKHYGSCNKRISRELKARGITPTIGPRRAEIPNLAELAREFSVVEIAERTGVHVRTIRRQFRKEGIPFPPYRRGGKVSANARPIQHRRNDIAPMPEGFATRAAGKTINAVAIEIRRHHGTVRRWFDEAGITPAVYQQGLKPCPDDFEVHAWTETNILLAERYGCSDTLITRWRRLKGIPSPKYQNPPKRPRVGAAKVAAAPYFVIRPQFRGAESHRDTTIAGRAADYLRSPPGGGWLVHRCDKIGVADPKGDYFRVGTALKTEDALLQMADKKGFRDFERKFA